VRYDFRFKKKNGDYIRVLHQVAVVEHDETGGIIRTLGVHTDITHLKREGRPVMSFIGIEGEPSYLDIDVKSKFIENKKILTNREKEILKLLMEGKLSKEVSDILNISKQTVDTHRKNMLRRNSLNNTGELIGKAIKQGWI
jgi:DNA-binding CsgD family transcriptional regulator